MPTTELDPLLILHDAARLEALYRAWSCEPRRAQFLAFLAVTDALLRTEAPRPTPRLPVVRYHVNGTAR